MIIHGLWIGPTLSRLELLTLTSFTHWGHEFQLWLYGDLRTPVPKGVSLRDAREILPGDRIFRKRTRDREAGVGEGSVSPFSDLFRYKLLYEHGGVWSDMDVTCLRPFDLADDYVFRPHQLGMIGNLMKCPKGCELMMACYEESELIANEDVDWLAQVRILNNNVERLGLSKFIRSDISNEDSWNQSVRQFVEAYTPIPDSWHAIHWLNEFWLTLGRDDGHYRGRKVTAAALDKNHPPPGSTLHELYRYHGLVDPREPFKVATHGRGGRGAGPSRPAIRAEARPRASQLNVLLPAVGRGSAERIALEAIRGLGASGVGSAVYVMDRVEKNSGVPTSGTLQVFHGDRSKASFRRIALEVSSSPTPLLYTHQIPACELSHLWELGVATVPVIHEPSPRWLDPPTGYNHPNVPFVVAAADSIADEIRALGCARPVVTIRHELQRWFRPEELSRGRQQLREAHGVAQDTLLIGMVGEFCPQRAYTRAVRVLAAVQRTCKAKLLILGGWDNPIVGGRTAYEAACGLALELGVMADLITPGGAPLPELYFGAFDVFLNTSLFEGLPISLLEAARAGCPIVAADIGGIREAAAADTLLVRDPADIDGYADGVLATISRSERTLRGPPIEADLIPRLWALLAKHGIDAPRPTIPSPRGTLFVTQGLHIGGPSRSLTNLLTRLPETMKTALCVVDGISLAAARADIEDALVPILELKANSSVCDAAEQILTWFEQLDMHSICFWNVQPELKLLLGKITQQRAICLIDVSPGPMLFDELEAAAPFQQRLAFTSDDYLRRLDHFVALYSDGTPKGDAQPRAVAVIPLAPAPPPRFVRLPPPDYLPPDSVDPALAIGTCCRIVPDKKIEFLIEMMQHVRARLPGASLTIVGGPDASTQTYFDEMRLRALQAHQGAVRFVGAHEDVAPFLVQFQVFVMVSERQGCPNASLEAMAMGRPVVANPSGGTAEQVVDGTTGFIAANPAFMASRVIELLEDPEKRRAFGEAGRARIAERFSVDAMVRRFSAVLGAEADQDQFTSGVHPVVREDTGKAAGLASLALRKRLR